jgi:hypothetical protein
MKWDEVIGTKATKNYKKDEINMSKRKICIVTGSRAEYGLLYWLIKEIKKIKILNFSSLLQECI